MDDNAQSSRTQAIAALNDQFRQTFVGGTVLVTVGIESLPSDVRAMVLRNVATYEAFTPDNDPHQEHDFGSLDLAGRRIFWKIDYYDNSLKHGSDDPADAKTTHRVLTIMLAEEY